MKTDLLNHYEIERIDIVSDIHNRYVELPDGRMKFTPITNDAEILDIMKKAHIPYYKKEEVKTYLKFGDVSTIDDEGNIFAKGGKVKKKEDEPKIVRYYFEDEEFEYKKGGDVYAGNPDNIFLEAIYNRVNKDDIDMVRVGFGDELRDQPFSGNVWDSYDQHNTWYYRGKSLYDEADGDNDTMEDIFIERVSKEFGAGEGKKAYDTIMKFFNQNYIDDEGVIKEK